MDIQPGIHMYSPSPTSTIQPYAALLCTHDNDESLVGGSWKKFLEKTLTALERALFCTRKDYH